MCERLEQVTVSNFRDNVDKYTQESIDEIVLTHSGKPIGVYMGINAWQSMQKILSLLGDNPENFLQSLIYHRQFQKTGNPVGISLEEFISSYE